MLCEIKCLIIGLRDSTNLENVTNKQNITRLPLHLWPPTPTNFSLPFSVKSVEPDCCGHDPPFLKLQQESLSQLLQK